MNRVRTLATLTLTSIISVVPLKGVTVGKTAGYDHSSINAAINDPGFAGEDIILGPGTYEEDNIVLDNRSLFAESSNSPELFIVSGPDTSDGDDIFSSVANARIEGITIRNGRSGIHTTEPSGGLNEIQLKNLIIEGNTDTPENSNGGGIRAPYGNLTITNCIIRLNMGTTGAGISYFANGGTLTISNSTIEGNISSGSFEGGGISLDPQSSMTISDSVIQDNIAFKGAGLAIWGSATLTNVQILNNDASDDGGGIHKGALDEETALLTIIGGRIEGNEGDRGGGIYLRGTQPRLDSSAIITNNTALRGDAGSGGGIRCSDSNQVAITENSVTQNTPDNVTCVTTVFEPPIDETPTDNSNAGNRGSAIANDPINTFSGELFTEPKTDLDLGGVIPLTFERTYASHLHRNNIRGDLGINWRHNFDFQAIRDGTTFRYITDKGRVTNFTQDQNTSEWVQQDNLDTPYQVTIEDNADAVVYDPTDRRFYTFDFTTDESVAGKLKQVQDANGNTHTVVHQTGTGQLQSVADGLGRMLSFTYNNDEQPKIANVTTDSNQSIEFEYSDISDTELLTLFTGANSKETHYLYLETNEEADRGFMTHMVLPEGNTPYAQTFFDSDTPSLSGRVATQTDGLGATSKFEYNGFETTIIDSDDHERIHTHTATGEFASREDQAGNTFTMGSDSTGRRNSLTDRLGYSSGIIFSDASGEISLFENALGGQSLFNYEEIPVNGSVIEELQSFTDADGSTQTFERDSNGNVTKHTDSEGSETTFTYNSNGQLLVKTNALGGTTTNTYNPDGTLATNTDPFGNEIKFDYDSNRRLSKITYADGSEKTITYDENGNPLTATDPSGTLTLTYDDNGNLTRVTDDFGSFRTFSYDVLDRHSGWTGFMGDERSITYNSYGRVISVTDANNNTTTFDRNSQGRAEKLINPDGTEYLFKWNAEDILESFTDSLGNKTTYVSDGLGRFTERVSPLGLGIKLEYDPLSRVKSKTNAHNQTTLYHRNSLGFLTGIETNNELIKVDIDRDPLANITRIVDANGNPWLSAYNLGGLLTSHTDPLGNEQSQTYNNRNWPDMVMFPGDMGSLEYQYDGVGNVTKKTYSDGTVMDYIYDANNNLTFAGDVTLGYNKANLVIESNGIITERDSSGRPISTTFAEGKTITYSYDSMDNVIGINDWIGPNGISLDYNPLGKRTRIERPNGINTDIGWDEDGRLIEISDGVYMSIQLSLDGLGQISKAIRDVPIRPTAAALESYSNTYNAASQATDSTYNGMGALVNDGVNQHNWDLAGRLGSIDGLNFDAQFTYNDLNHLTSYTEGEVTREFALNYALPTPLPVVERENDVDLKYNVFTPEGDLLYFIDAITNDRHYYHFDEQGNTSFITDEAGDIENEYSFTPYGELIEQTGSLENFFTWQGQSGAMYLRENYYYTKDRYFAAKRARHISRDPVKKADPLSTNPYQHAKSNPVKNEESNRVPEDLEDFVWLFLKDPGQFVISISSIVGAEKRKREILEEEETRDFQVGRIPSLNRAEHASENAARDSMSSDNEAHILHLEELYEEAAKLNRLGSATRSLQTEQWAIEAKERLERARNGEDFHPEDVREPKPWAPIPEMTPWTTDSVESGINSATPSVNP